MNLFFLEIFVKIYLDIVTFIYKLLVEFKSRFSFVNLSFVCELVCIYVWIFETLLMWLDSQMHFFQQGTLQPIRYLPRFQPIT